MSLLTDYLAEERKLFKTFRSAGVYSFLSSVCMLGMPIFMFSVYDSILKSRSLETLVAMFLFSFLILVVYGIFDYVRTILLTKAGLELESKMAGLILAAELSRQSDASVQSVRDIGTIRQIIASPAFYTIFDLPMLPLFLTLIFLIHPILGSFVLMGAVALFFLGMYADRSTAHLNKEHMEAAIAGQRMMETQVASQEYIRGQGMYREAVRMWGATHGNQLRKFLQSFGITARFSAATKAIRQIIQISMIGGGALLVINDQATAGVIFATAIIGGRALAPVEQIVGGWRSLRTGWDTRTNLLKRLEDMTLPEDRTKLPRPKGKLQIDRVMYVPRPGMPPIIRGVAATIEPGDSVAVVGPSGAGKSTLAKLLVGYLVPNSGKIYLDGQDLHAWDPIARGVHIGYMPQQVTFFDGTVRENIARLREDDPEEWAIDAARRAGVHELILSLPQGYDTVIKRGVFMPSGGQAQLIALARALYGDPAILILDEPNAALDNIGEQTLHNALKTANAEGVTVVVVSQRPSILSIVSKVMVMTDGTVKDFGPKEKVMGAGNVQTSRSAGAAISANQANKPAPAQPAAAAAQPAAPAQPATAAKPATEQSVTEKQKEQLKKQLKVEVADVKVKEA